MATNQPGRDGAAESMADSLAKAVAEGGIYAVTGAIGKPAAEAEWPMVRRQMQNLGLLKKRVEDGHHWLIPQRWKWVPAPLRTIQQTFIP